MAWALTAGVNFTQIIDDLWYRDIARLDPGAVDRWEASGSSPGTRLVTQMLWGSTTHIGCGWTQIQVTCTASTAPPHRDRLQVGSERWAGEYPGSYENFFVCNYGVGGNRPGQPVYRHPDCGEPGPQPGPQRGGTQQVFADSSVEVRAVVGLCLEAVQCLAGAGAGCEKPAELCHSRGPGGGPPPAPPSRSALECRVEELLCWAGSGAGCGAGYTDCRAGRPSQPGQFSRSAQ